MSSADIWVCQAHYEALCKEIGYEIPVYTIPNWTEKECEIKDCHIAAKHLISLYDVKDDVMVKS